MSFLFQDSCGESEDDCDSSSCLISEDEILEFRSRLNSLNDQRDKLRQQLRQRFATFVKTTPPAAGGGKETSGNAGDKLNASDVLKKTQIPSGLESGKKKGHQNTNNSNRSNKGSASSNSKSNKKRRSKMAAK